MDYRQGPGSLEIFSRGVHAAGSRFQFRQVLPGVHKAFFDSAISVLAVDMVTGLPNATPFDCAVRL